MSTFTINRNYDAESIFVALNDTCYRDYRDSQYMAMEVAGADHVSLLEKIRHFFER